MVSTRRQAKAAAALGLAAASLSSKQGVTAFYSDGGVGRSPLTFVPPPAIQPWPTRSFSSHHPAAPLNSGGRARRLYVRERSGGLDSYVRSERAAGGTFVSGVTRSRTFASRWGSRNGGRSGSSSKLFMVTNDDVGPSSTSAKGGDAAMEVEPFMPAAIQDALPEGLQRQLSKINRDPAKLTFYLNAATIFLFAAFAAFKLATVDGDIARGWTWYEVLLRVPGDNFYRYEATVSESPIVTKALTSCVAYGLGDLTAQLFTGKDLETIDLKRTARSATAGLLVHGPLCHYWIELMQTYLDFDGAWWNFIPKVIADQTVWSVFLNAAYSTMIMSLQGLPPAEVWHQVKTTAWPALTSSWRFWPLIHCCSFSKAIPKDLKLLFIDCMEIIWVTILSTVANGDRQADSDEAAPEEGVPALAALADGEDFSSFEVSQQAGLAPSEVKSEEVENEKVHS